MARPAVSIITPAYNAEAYLADTIRSAQAQTFRDFEMLIVDDGSTDGTAWIARQFALGDDRIRVISQANAGISGARNTALARAEAPIFVLLDSDDVWFPNYLEEQVCVLTSAPSAGVVSANALNLGGSFDGMPLRRLPSEVHPISLRELIEVEESVCIMSMIRREVYERIGGFDTTLPSSEDYDFWLRTLIAGFEILFNGKPLGWYRRRAQSVSADNSRMFGSISDVLRKTRAAVPAGSAEMAAIDRQLERFERAAIANAAKLALYRGDFSAASEGFAELANRGASLRLTLAALAARRAPSLLLFAHRAASALRVRRRHLAGARAFRLG
jgi:glycosyltransferase involved in cell wall biosynthesis